MPPGWQPHEDGAAVHDHGAAVHDSPVQLPVQGQLPFPAQLPFPDTLPARHPAVSRLMQKVSVPTASVAVTTQQVGSADANPTNARSEAALRICVTKPAVPAEGGDTLRRREVGQFELSTRRPGAAMRGELV